MADYFGRKDIERLPPPPRRPPEPEYTDPNPEFEDTFGGAEYYENIFKEAQNLPPRRPTTFQEIPEVPLERRLKERERSILREEFPHLSPQEGLKESYFHTPQPIPEMPHRQFNPMPIPSEYMRKDNSTKAMGGTGMKALPEGFAENLEFHLKHPEFFLQLLKNQKKASAKKASKSQKKGEK